MKMNVQRCSIALFIPLLFLFGCFFAIETASAADHGEIAAIEFPPDLQSYGDAGNPILGRLAARIQADPFNLVGTLIFSRRLLIASNMSTKKSERRAKSRRRRYRTRGA